MFWKGCLAKSMSLGIFQGRAFRASRNGGWHVDEFVSQHFWVGVILTKITNMMFSLNIFYIKIQDYLQILGCSSLDDSVAPRVWLWC